MKLFVDDLRDPAKRDKNGKLIYVKDPENWHWAKTVTEAIRVLATMPIEEVSLDHDIMHTIPQQVTIPPEIEMPQEKIDTIVDLTLKAIDHALACPEDYTAVAHYIVAMPADRRPKVVYVHTASTPGSGRLHNILRGHVDDLVRIRYSDKFQ